MRREMAMLAVAALVVVVFGGVPAEAKHKKAAPVPAPAPADDCSNLFLGLADCLSFVTPGSNDTKPTSTCCSGLKTILSTDAQCLCVGLKSSGSLGIPINMTKALSLPPACHLSAPSINNCGAMLSPTGAPAGSPGSSDANTPGSSVVAPASGKNASPALGVSLSSVVLCLVGAIFSSL